MYRYNVEVATLPAFVLALHAWCHHWQLGLIAKLLVVCCTRNGTISSCRGILRTTATWTRHVYLSASCGLPTSLLLTGRRVTLVLQLLCSVYT